MTCTDFLARHSEYLDGLLDETAAARLRAHAEACASCARYDRVVRRGTALARDLLPQVAVSEDFAPRMRHRLYHERDDMARRQPLWTSLYAAALALLMVTGGAWALMLSGEPTPIVEGPVVFAAAPASFDAVPPSAPAAPSTPAPVAHETHRTDVVKPQPSRTRSDEVQVASAGNWPVYSRGVAAVVFHEPSLVARPVQLRGGVRPVTAPLVVRY